ncbi:MAG: methionyl-tRNA formyltransferase [Anaeroplasmataceae bacterium]|nr:methionyl-tRNA formyltransferase [Anaeroplasmataceae bacterium]
MKIVFMGTPEFAVPILEALHERYEVVLVVSQPNRIKKKNEMVETPVCACAKRLGLTVFQPEKLKDSYEPLVEAKADILVTAAYGQYVPSKILNLFQKTLNVHGSLLPAYRGGAPIQRAIMNGEKTTGITIIEMAKKLDAGKMYAKKECPILDTDNSKALFEKLSIIGRDLLLEVIEDVYLGKLEGIVQDEALVSYAPNLSKEEERIDFNKPAYLVARHIQGLSLDPGAYFMFHDQNFKVLKATAVADDSNALPGTILSLKKKFLVKTLEGAVELDWIIAPGKKMLDVKSFVNGQKFFKELDVISC